MEGEVSCKTIDLYEVREGRTNNLTLSSLGKHKGSISKTKREDELPDKCHKI